MSEISPQGYVYGEAPKSTNPFWGSEEVNVDITASATVDDTTGTPAVEVTVDDNNINFAFTGLKGETGAAGATGPQGEKGETGATGAQGENGISPTVVSTGSTASGESAGTITGADGTTITVYNGAQGEKGETGAQGEKGSDADISTCVTNVSITNENGVYGLKQTKNGVESDVGSIEVPSTDNLLAEVTDSVVENTTTGYDYHTIKETENNGTQNDVGSFYLARKQITALNADGSFSMVDQSGTETTGQLEFPSGGSGLLEAQDISIPTEDGTNIYVPGAQTFTISGKTTTDSITVTIVSGGTVILKTSETGSVYADDAVGVSPEKQCTVTISGTASAKYILIAIQPYRDFDKGVYSGAAQTFYATQILANPLQMLLKGFAILSVTGSDTDDGLVVTTKLEKIIIPKYYDGTVYATKQYSSATGIVVSIA